MLLEWLSEAEQTLRFRGALPDDAEALQALIDVHKVGCYSKGRGGCLEDPPALVYLFRGTEDCIFFPLLGRSS